MPITVNPAARSGAMKLPKRAAWLPQPCSTHDHRAAVAPLPQRECVRCRCAAWISRPARRSARRRRSSRRRGGVRNMRNASRAGERRAQRLHAARRSGAAGAAGRATHRAPRVPGRVCAVLPSGGHVGGEFGRHAHRAAAVEIQADVLRRGARQRAAIRGVTQLEAARHAQLAIGLRDPRGDLDAFAAATPRAGSRSRCAAPPCRAAAACSPRRTRRAPPNATTRRDRASADTRRCSRVRTRRCPASSTSTMTTCGLAMIPGVEHAN